MVVVNVLVDHRIRFEAEAGAEIDGPRYWDAQDTTSIRELAESQTKPANTVTKGFVDGVSAQLVCDLNRVR